MHDPQNKMADATRRIDDLLQTEARLIDALECRPHDPSLLCSLARVQRSVEHSVDRGDERHSSRSRLHDVSRAGARRASDDEATRRVAAGVAQRVAPHRASSRRRVRARVPCDEAGSDDDDDSQSVDNLDAWTGDVRDPVPAVTRLTRLSSDVGLQDHQRDGVDFLVRRASEGVGCILAFVMGLGKTRTVFVALEVLRMPLAVVVAPASVAASWHREHASMASLSTCVRTTCASPIHSAADASARVSAWRRRTDGVCEILVLTFDSLASLSRRDASDVYRLADVLVVDEVHLAQNSDARRRQALHGFKTRVRWGLTGTPVANRPGDLYSVVRLVDPHLVCGLSAEDVRREFEVVIRRGQWCDADERARRLARERMALLRVILAPAVLHRSQRVLCETLPPKTETVLVYGYDAEARAALAQTVDCRAAYLAAQSATDRVLRHVKRDVARCILESLPADESALVFSEHPDTLRAVCLSVGSFRGARVIEGRTPPRQRAELLDEFDAGDVSVLCMSLGAAAVGVNCQRASCVVLLDPSENPSRDAQAVCRAWRLGQTRPVRVYRLAARDTVDVRVLRRGILKTAMARRMVESAAPSVTTLTRADVTTDEATSTARLRDADTSEDPVVKLLGSLGKIDGWLSMDSFYGDVEEDHDAVDVARAHNACNAERNCRPREFVGTSGVTHVAAPREIIVPVRKRGGGNSTATVLAPPPIPLVEHDTAGRAVLRLLRERPSERLLALASGGDAAATLELDVSFAPAAVLVGEARVWTDPVRCTSLSVTRKRVRDDEPAQVCRTRARVGERVGPWSNESAAFVSA